jgi:hypothetical protein
MIDSNFLQSSDTHFYTACDRLQSLPEVEFNQGLDASLFTGDRADRLLELPLRRLQFSWDMPGDREIVLRAIDTCTGRFNRRKIVVLHLVNNGEDPQQALENMMELRNLKVTPFAMRYQPLDTLKKNEYVAPEWDPYDLYWFCRFWCRQAFLRGADFYWPEKGAIANRRVSL